MLENIAAIIVAFFTGGALKYILDYALKSKKIKVEEKRNDFKTLFYEIHKIYRILNNISFHCGAERVLIMRVDDSGDIPSVNSPINSSVLYEVFDSPLTPVKSHWQKVKVGEIYIKEAQKMYDRGSSHYKVEYLEPSELKDLHVEHNTKYVENYFITNTSSYFLYLSIQFSESIEEKDSIYRNSIRINLEKLKQTFKEESYVETA